MLEFKVKFPLLDNKTIENHKDENRWIGIHTQEEAEEALKNGCHIFLTEVDGDLIPGVLVPVKDLFKVAL